MKHKSKYIPDTATIERYWGSMEAYLEEQRRTALVKMEGGDKPSRAIWRWDLRRNPKPLKTTDSKRKPPEKISSFHFFGHH
jgi:hypothetical protein